MNYKTEKLKDLAITKTGKLDSNAANENGEYPFFTCDPQTLRINRWAYDTEAVLLAGNNASGNYTAKYYKGKFNAYQRTYIIETADENKLNVRFLCYAMNQQLRLLKTMSSGSTTKFLTIRMLHDLDIPLPKLHVQERIVNILGTIDDLIENNQKQIKLLEEAAQRLYKEWFVDLRFPEHEKTEIIDGVPEGWTLRLVSSFGEVVTGKTPSTSKAEYYGGNIPFVKIPDMHNVVFPIITEATLSEQGAASQKNKYIPRNSIMVSCIATVGLVNIAVTSCQTNQQINSLILKKPNNLYYLYSSLKRIKELLDGVGSNGATMTNVNKTKFERIELLYPDEELVNKYQSFCTPIFDKIYSLSQCNLRLSETRDRLLPKLMSGEIEV